MWFCRYHERDRIIKAENKAGRWAAFMSFLNELYGLVSDCPRYMTTAPTSGDSQSASCMLVLVSPLSHEINVEISRH